MKRFNKKHCQPECPCRKKKCARYGKCEECRAYHYGKSGFPACEREFDAKRAMEDTRYVLEWARPTFL